MPKISVGDSFTVALISGNEKVWMGGGVVSRISVEIVCLTVLKISVEETFTVALLSVIDGYRKSLDKRGGGEYQDFPWIVFCLTVVIISVGESFTFSLISGIEKVWVRGGYQNFPSQVFVSVMKNFVEEPICAVFQKISGSWNVNG